MQYYALLREQAGRRDETVSTAAGTPGELFRGTFQTGITSPCSRKCSRSRSMPSFATGRIPLAKGDLVVFIPPVAGG